ncbi:DUF3806 domain-containing protein [Rhodopirellula sp. MGV]|uniref:DUF3806 domain-containing protein n=1 Tax=Rhodopirellula sp. MGV TaxID=2023130 RepID=UPI00130410B0|nr:DUF3806 domain-containing protein [Rhodopirellula sp. MGV]
MEIRDLSAEEIEGLNEERKWLDDLLRQFGPEHVLNRTVDDVATLQSLLEVDPFATGDEDSLEILGAAFGDVIAATLGLEWVVVTDEYGTDFAIKHPTKFVLAYPRDMIIRRVEAGEVINLTDLYEGVVDALEKQIADDGLAAE